MDDKPAVPNEPEAQNLVTQYQNKFSKKVEIEIEVKGNQVALCVREKGMILEQATANGAAVLSSLARVFSIRCFIDVFHVDLLPISPFAEYFWTELLRLMDSKKKISIGNVTLKTVGFGIDTLLETLNPYLLMSVNLYCEEFYGEVELLASISDMSLWRWLMKCTLKGLVLTRDMIEYISDFFILEVTFDKLECNDIVKLYNYYGAVGFCKDVVIEVLEEMDIDWMADMFCVEVDEELRHRHNGVNHTFFTYDNNHLRFHCSCDRSTFTYAGDWAAYKRRRELCHCFGNEFVRSGDELFDKGGNKVDILARMRAEIRNRDDFPAPDDPIVVKDYKLIL